VSHAGPFPRGDRAVCDDVLRGDTRSAAGARRRGGASGRCDARRLDDRDSRRGRTPIQTTRGGGALFRRCCSL